MTTFFSLVAARRITRGVLFALSAALMVGLPPAQAQAAAAKPAVARAADADQSRIGAGDTIRITVYQSPDLSIETRVNEGGAISYPLLGRVQMAGLTVTAAEQHLASELKRRDFVKDPQVIIVVTQVRANQVNVLGQVGKPGRYPLDLVGMRMTEVLALAGGIIAGAGSDTVVLTGTRAARREQARHDGDAGGGGRGWCDAARHAQGAEGHAPRRGRQDADGGAVDGRRAARWRRRLHSREPVLTAGAES
jgi:protein involved in polysaccharide export with SLBB domain